MVGKRLLGTVVPVGALRGSKPSAVGEFPDLAEFAALCKRMDIGLIQLLPVNDTGYESSPYFSLTSVALHPLYLRIGDLEEAAGFGEKIDAINARFSGEIRFPYLEVLRAKMGLLREIYAANADKIIKSAGESGVLGEWIGLNPWVKEYSVYRRIKEANGEKSWKEWPGFRDVTPDQVSAMWSDPKSRADHLFWAWLQRALDVQFGAAAKAVADSGIMLKGDLPILMNDDSHDVWAHGEIFVQDLSAGAPPDMYSPDGQNWGFPLYNWEAHEKDDYAWWKQRLAVAEKYYGAYRIDHVLGFFRIWAASKGDYSSALGRYVPYRHIATYELAKMGFDKGRIRWLSQPHIPTSEVYDAIRAATSIEDEINNAAGQVFSKALDRIGNEELWLFKPTVKGEKDIHVMGLHGAAVSYLLKAWQNRLLLEYEDGKFCPTWRYRESRAYQTLSDAERQLLEMLLEQHTVKSEKIWESQGMRLLSVLAKSSEMLPCAEDLGAVPPCVPKVLTKLNILGLRVLRWHRRWDLNSNPYIPFRSYPELSVCTPAVHDSSTVREWWEREADQDQLSAFIGVPSMPKIYNPGAAKAILSKTASAASRFRVFQFQDLLHLSNRWYDRDPEAERINVPGTNNEFNWTYRFPAPIAEIGGDAGLVGAIAELAGIGAAK